MNTSRGGGQTQDTPEESGEDESPPIPETPPDELGESENEEPLTQNPIEEIPTDTEQEPEPEPTPEEDIQPEEEIDSESDSIPYESEEDDSPPADSGENAL